VTAESLVRNTIQQARAGMVLRRSTCPRRLNVHSTRGVSAPASVPYIVVGALGHGSQNAEDQYAHASLLYYYVCHQRQCEPEQKGKARLCLGRVLWSSIREGGGQRRMIGKGSKNGARMNGMGCPVDEMCKYADPASKPQMTTKMSLRGLFFFHSGLVF
jgi:hypothetical protein